MVYFPSDIFWNPFFYSLIVSIALDFGQNICHKTVMIMIYDWNVKCRKDGKKFCNQLWAENKENHKSLLKPFILTWNHEDSIIKWLQFYDNNDWIHEWVMNWMTDSCSDIFLCCIFIWSITVEKLCHNKSCNDEKIDTEKNQLRRQT